MIASGGQIAETPPVPRVISMATTAVAKAAKPTARTIAPVTTTGRLGEEEALTDIKRSAAGEAALLHGTSEDPGSE
jgi:hypothetical protein